MKTLEEVLKRAAQDSGETTLHVEETHEEHRGLGGFGAYALAGAGLIGALSSALFFVRPTQSTRRNRDSPPPPENPAAGRRSHIRRNTAPAEFDYPELLNAHVIKEVQTQQSRLKSSLESIQTQVQALSVAVVSRSPLQSPAVLEEQREVRRAVQAFVGSISPGKRREETVRTVITWLLTIAGSPEDKKAAKIRTDSPQYQNTLARVPASKGLMTALGFTEQDNAWDFNDSQANSLLEGLRALREELEAMTKKTEQGWSLTPHLVPQA